MELTDMEKRLIFQAEGYGKSEVTYELRMCLPYIPDPAKKYFDSLGITKLPSVKSLREEYAGLLEQKRKAYSAYKQARAEMRELFNVKSNVEHLLDIHSGRKAERRQRVSKLYIRFTIQCLLRMETCCRSRSNSFVSFL